jgi:lysozyme family protein
MKNEVFEVAFSELMVSEGGYVYDPKDPGGETKYGISKRAYPELDIKNLTKQQAKEIFRQDYWEVCRCEEIPECLAIIVSDMAYNSGNSRAIKLLQKSLGIKEDGIIGSITVGKANEVDKLNILKKYRENRINFYKGLKTFSIYGKGWVARTNKVFELAKGYIVGIV